MRLLGLGSLSLSLSLSLIYSAQQQCYYWKARHHGLTSSSRTHCISNTQISQLESSIFKQSCSVQVMPLSSHYTILAWFPTRWQFFEIAETPANCSHSPCPLTAKVRGQGEWFTQRVKGCGLLSGWRGVVYWEGGRGGLAIGPPGKCPMGRCTFLGRSRFLGRSGTVGRRSGACYDPPSSFLWWASPGENCQGRILFPVQPWRGVWFTNTLDYNSVLDDVKTLL